MDHRVYWIWMQHAFGAGSYKIRRVLESYLSPQQFWEAGVSGWKASTLCSEKEWHALEQYSLSEAEACLALHEQAGIQVLTPESQRYPNLLRQIYDLPAVLYVKGQLPDLEEQLSIAIVGTRRASSLGLREAGAFGKGLAEKGIVVVSGGAMGIDTAAHRGALAANGTTICVLGCGIGYDYLSGSAAMREKITEHGALLSEYPIGTPPMRGNFPIRNRLISGLCDGLLVVEADAHSGSLITARQAVEQNRDLFAMPGRAFVENSTGTNELIKSGAKLTTKVTDILEEYVSRYPKLRRYLPAEFQEETIPKAIPRGVVPSFPPLLQQDRTAQIAQWEAAVEESKRTGIWTIPLEALPSEKEIAGSAIWDGKEQEVPVLNRTESPMRAPASHPPQAPRASSEKAGPPVLQSEPESKEKGSDPTLEALSPTAQQVAAALSRTEKHISQLSAETGIPVRKILAAVTELELEEKIQVLSGNRYRLP